MNCQRCTRSLEPQVHICKKFENALKKSKSNSKSKSKSVFFVTKVLNNKINHKSLQLQEIYAYEIDSNR